MALFIARKPANTQLLPEIAKIGNGSDYSGTSSNDPPDPDRVTFFQTLFPQLDITLVSAPSDLFLVAGGFPAQMTVTSLSVEKGGDLAYEISGFSIQLDTDLYADAQDGTLTTLPAKIFRLADDMRGSAGADFLSGFKGNDVIRGNGGNDDIRGGRGADTLFGNAGSDRFFFNDGFVGADTIEDFQHNLDRILLDRGQFLGMQGGPGTSIAPANFGIGVKAADASDRIIYNPASGIVRYDRDGTGDTFAPIKFAILDNTPTLTPSDFLFIAN